MAPRASQRQRLTTFAVMPCDIPTFGTDVPGKSHSATCAVNAWLRRSRSCLLACLVPSWVGWARSGLPRTDFELIAQRACVRAFASKWPPHIFRRPRRTWGEERR